jgi:hypothetical protein
MKIETKQKSGNNSTENSAGRLEKKRRERPYPECTIQGCAHQRRPYHPDTDSRSTHQCTFSRLYCANSRLPFRNFLNPVLRGKASMALLHFE